MGLQTYRAIILAGTEVVEMVDERKALTGSAIPVNAFGFYFFDADEAEMEENPVTAQQHNVSGRTYIGMVHQKDDDMIDGISPAEMAFAIGDADTDKVVACSYYGTVMLFPFFDGRDKALVPNIGPASDFYV